MKKRIMMLVFALLLIGSNLHAAGDLTVDGNVIVHERIIYNQSGKENYTSTGWNNVPFTPAFSSPAAVIVNGAKAGPAYTQSQNFIVIIRPLQGDNFTLGFQYKAIDNATNTAHAVNAGCPTNPDKCDTIHWIAIAPVP